MSLEILKEVGLNILAQIMFFIVVFWVLPGLVNFFEEKYGGAGILRNKLHECKTHYELSNIDRKLNIWGKINDVQTVIISWTVNLIINFIRYITGVFTLYKPKLYPEIGSGKVNEDGCNGGVKGALYLNMSINRFTYWNPMHVLGGLLSDVEVALVGPLLAALLLSLILPQTFASLSASLIYWTPMLQVLDMDFFLTIYNCLVDIVFERFIVGGFIESPILFIIFIFVSVLFFSEGHYDLSKKMKHLVCRIPGIIVVVSIINILLAMLNIGLYESLMCYSNILALVILIVVLLKEVAYIVKGYLNYIAMLVLDKILPNNR